MSIIKRAVVAVTAAAAASVTLAASASAHPNHGHEQVGQARAATARYHSIATAGQAGYALFTDAAGIACIAEPGVGAMGVHYVNSQLAGDDQLRADQPEALVYRPSRDGTLRLAALEYIVFQDAWQQHHHGPPRLFGHELMLTTSPNRYGLPAFYSLHAWVWTHNPAGTFATWNPRVHCP